MKPVVELQEISKRFGTLTANDNITLHVLPGEIHALLGENGAGKSTLMKILYGLYQPDEGTIKVQGQPVRFKSPRDALHHGIGMVTQHFSLVHNLTVTENVILGAEDGVLLNRQAAAQRVRETAQRYGLSIDPHAEIRHLSVGEQQRVEIIKALYRECKLLILDEPTAVLTPQESAALFTTLKELVRQGLSILFISHKLAEVLSVSNRVTVLAAGRVVGEVQAAETTPALVARMMVGREVTGVGGQPRAAVGDAPVLLAIENVEAPGRHGRKSLQGVTLQVRAGEIVAVTGVAGNGQSELVQVLGGMLAPSAGRVVLDGQDITGADPGTVTRAGLGRIPEDRLKGVVGTLTVAENLALEDLDAFTGSLGSLDHAQMHQFAREMIEAFQIKATPTTRIRHLSGGNMQKVILARVLSRKPKAIVAAQPIRGLDIGAIEYVHTQLLAQKQQGTAVLLVSEDLDEVLALADRIAVMYEGRIAGILQRDEANAERLGLLMAGVTEVPSQIHA